MASSLFGNQPGNSLSQLLSSARAMVGNDPRAAFEALMRSNPRFNAFVQANQGKTPEQAFHDYGLDYGMVKPFL